MGLMEFWEGVDKGRLFVVAGPMSRGARVAPENICVITRGAATTGPDADPGVEPKVASPKRGVNVDPEPPRVHFPDDVIIEEGMMMISLK